MKITIGNTEFYKTATDAEKMLIAHAINFCCMETSVDTVGIWADKSTLQFFIAQFAVECLRSETFLKLLTEEGKQKALQITGLLRIEAERDS